MRTMLREHQIVADLVHGEAHKLRANPDFSLGLRLQLVLLRKGLGLIRACRIRDRRRGRRGCKGGKRRSKAQDFWSLTHFYPCKPIPSRPRLTNLPCVSPSPANPDLGPQDAKSKSQRIS